MSDTPTHCTKCGRALVRKRERGAFSAATGEWELGQERLQCPRIGHLPFGMGGTFHDWYSWYGGLGTVLGGWSQGGWH